MDNGSRTAPAVVLAIGIALGGWLAGQGLVQARRSDRFVTVKGVAERVVTADTGLWPLRFVAADDDLARAQARIEGQRRAVMRFLARHGLDSTSTELQGLEVTDVRANPYFNGPAANRYVITLSLMVRSEDPGTLQSASQRVSELVDAGVVLTASGPGGGPTYLFTKLNDFKPQMIAEATGSARQAAERFATDSRSRLGGIRRANQGIFEILPRDQAPGIMEGQQVQKTLRVVTTVEYQLEG